MCNTKEPLKLRPIEDGNSDFDSVIIKEYYSPPAGGYHLLYRAPSCKKHGAMLKVSVFGELDPPVLPLTRNHTNAGYWRCMYPGCRSGCIQDAQF